MEEKKRKRLSAKEQAAIVDLMAATDRLDLLLQNEGIQRRIASIQRGKFKLVSSRNQMAKMLEELLDTAPTEQLLHMKRQLQHVRCWVYVGNVPPRSPEKEEGRFLNMDELNVFAEAMKAGCFNCTLDCKQDRRRCPRAKLMEKLPIDKTYDDPSDCGWFDTLLGIGGI